MNTTNHPADAENTFADSRRARPSRVPSALHQARSNAVDNEEAERFGAQHPGRLLSREADSRAERVVSGADHFTQTPTC